MTEESKIIYNKDGSLSCLQGRDAVELMRVVSVMTGIKLYVKTGGKMMLTRGVGIKKLLAMASTYTGIKYKLSEATKAAEDLKVWLELAKSTIPQETHNE